MTTGPAGSAGHTNTKYRPDIDGLRAIAVIAVLAFHAFPAWLPGGFIGVDVFFVISGYLISGIILNALQEDRFSFAEFYARRIRRIFPALAVVLAACYGFGWFVLFADDYQQLGRHIAAGVAFVSNIVLWGEAGYFDDAAETKPLQHLWSLGIEEQFYLAWPLLLFLAWRRRINPLWFTAALLAASFLLNVRNIRVDVVGTFYSPFTRFWELMVGGMLACLPHVGAPFSAPFGRANDAATIAGAALIVAAAGLLDGARHFPGLWALLPTIGAFLVIGAGPDAWLNRTLLSRRALVWIGLISYPLYLWHWPLLSFARIVNGETPSPVARLGIVTLSVGLAWLTYELVEKPIRFGTRGRYAVPMLCASMAALLAIAGFTYLSGGLIERAISRTDRAHFMQYYDRMHKSGIAEAYREECDFMEWPTGNTKASLDPSCTQPGARRTVFLWGDSYAQALSQGIRSILPAGTRLAQVATSLCRPTFTDVDAGIAAGRCLRSNEYAIARIKALRPDVVVLAQKGSHDQTDWAATAQQILALGARRVVLVGPAPRWNPSLPDVVTSQYWGKNYDRVSYGLEPAVFDLDLKLKLQYAGSPYLSYVSVVDDLCNAGGCQAVVPDSTDHDLIAFDAGHLTPKGSVFVAEKVFRRLLDPN